MGKRYLGMFALALSSLACGDADPVTPEVGADPPGSGSGQPVATTSESADTRGTGTPGTTGRGSTTTLPGETMGSAPTTSTGTTGMANLDDDDSGSMLDTGDTTEANPSASCPFTGSVRYTLAQDAQPSTEQAAAYARITEAMDRALAFYNCYSDIDKALEVQFDPGVATADGNVNGSIRFGSTDSMNFVTAMHEIAHTVGVGDPDFDVMIVDGVFSGTIANELLRELTGDPEAEVHGDDQHFWPYGLNYTTEFTSDEDGIRHCLLVRAIRQDMGWQ